MARIELRLYAAVEEAFADGSKCDGCQFLSTWQEYHGPGMRESMAECALLEKGEHLNQCPAVDPDAV